MSHPAYRKRLAILAVMLALGTAWAIRGSFGHEFGAAWAGSIGVLALLMVSGRKDWLQNWLAIAAAGALGWGVTGMISYGKVVGYGRSTDFLNTSYGLLSLFVIGGLFGFLGGGLTGMMLESSRKKKVNWAVLITQMVAGGYVVWGYLIYQLEWYMTPPRSELWAACLGASAALGWYMKRHHCNNAWYVAFSSLLGAGFGFAFGNFIQVLGNTSWITFNWWNVMEYSIGFFGGMGMAYGIFSRTWPEMRACSQGTHLWAGALLFLAIPLVTISSSFSHEQLTELGERLSISNLQQFHTAQWILIIGFSLAALIIIGVQLRKLLAGHFARNQVFTVLLTSWVWYKLLQVILSGIWYEYRFSSDDLAVPNILLVAYLIWYLKDDIPFHKPVPDKKFNSSLIRLFVGITVILLLLSAIAMNTHEELPGQEKRFSSQIENQIS